MVVCRRQGLRWRRGRRRWRRLWRPRKRWCRRRRPVVSASSSSLPKTCAADSFISAQLNWPAAVVRACPAAPLHRDRAACRFGHSSLRDLWVLKEGRLAAGCSVAGRSVASCYVAGCSVAGCSVAGCSVVMRPVRWVRAGRCETSWVASRTCIACQLEVRCR